MNTLKQPLIKDCRKPTMLNYSYIIFEKKHRFDIQLAIESKKRKKKGEQERKGREEVRNSFLGRSSILIKRYTMMISEGF